MTKMRILLLTARPGLEVNRRLVAAAASLDVEAVVVDSTRMTAAIGDSPALATASEDLLDPPPGAVLARVGNWRPDSVLAVLETAVAAGVATPNPPSAIRVARDHWRTVRVLAAAGLPVPATIAGADPEVLAARASKLGYPVVVKQRRSRMGVGVVLCHGRDHLEAVLDSMWRLGDEVVVQRYLPADGVSVRLLVIGGDVIAAARFTAAGGEWRSNAARGGGAEAHRAGTREIELSLTAARSMGLGICGVDLLPGPELTILEVNPTPGFVHLEDATGIDVAAAMISFLVR
jgi:RimK family alpha-L-glutamate ligase